MCLQKCNILLIQMYTNKIINVCHIDVNKRKYIFIAKCILIVQIWEKYIYDKLI